MKLIRHILCISEWYEHGALMLTDECTVVISGLLMGLNVIDYSMSLTGEELDRAVSHPAQYLIVHLACEVHSH